MNDEAMGDKKDVITRAPARSGFMVCCVPLLCVPGIVMVFCALSVCLPRVRAPRVYSPLSTTDQNLRYVLTRVDNSADLP